MEIGILGLTFHSGNKGCEALSYSFLELLNEVGKKHNDKIKVDFITILPTKKWIKEGFSFKKLNPLYYPTKEYSNISISCKYYINKLGKVVFLNSINRCKFVVDFTAGDSFTDIYGLERFYTRTQVKNIVIKKGIPFILGSQTIGPFNDEKVKSFAVDVIKRSKEVYTRDKQSFDYTLEISGRTPILTTDIAFALPYHEVNLSTSDKVRVGFNPSGLLWNSDFEKDNRFQLSVNYHEYCEKVISYLLEKGYEVYLIPHAFHLEGPASENDFSAALEIKKSHPECKVITDIATPMDAKSYIAKMDAFIGARMHATIAAFSSGVPVIPFSYSRKFEGLFESLKYDYIIHGKTDSTNEAIDKTMQYIEDRTTLKARINEQKPRVEQSNRFIVDEIERHLYS